MNAAAKLWTIEWHFHGVWLYLWLRENGRMAQSGDALKGHRANGSKRLTRLERSVSFKRERG